MASYPNNSFEEKFRADNICVAGIDEAGRGPLAGPVVAACAALPARFKYLDKLNDSKALKAADREELFDKIISIADDYGIGIISAERIDSINILRATWEAMALAARSMKKVKPGHLLIDGNSFNGCGIPFTTIVKGDAKCVSIAAASILAKVTRDRIMSGEAHRQFPQYGFDRHKGYGTKVHFEMIKKHGICRWHRKSFLKKFFYKEPELFDNI